LKIGQLVHSTNPETGGVAKAVTDISDALTIAGIKNVSYEDRDNLDKDISFVIAHGLWQWPGFTAYHLLMNQKIPYAVFPHGMLDPWFKKAYPLKHFKKQLFWWYRQGRILKNAHSVFFTTEEERQLAQKTFWPYQCKEVVTGLGVGNPPENDVMQSNSFSKKFVQAKNKKILLYMGRIHPKKGLDLLIDAFGKYAGNEHLLMIAGPIERNDSYYQSLFQCSQKFGNRILWTGMLDGDLKWGAIRSSEALILPSHQENYGMVVAEALSVGTPVLTTHKVNLWREVVQYDAGIVKNDDIGGINSLVNSWIKGYVIGKSLNAKHCFEEKLHIQKTAKVIIEIAKSSMS
jgi:glycosyltransferase involved in cell wall biosynthesis